MSVFNNHHVYIGSIATAYWIVSISSVYLNKLILDSIAAPLFVTWFQCLVTVVICLVAGEIGEQTRNLHAYSQVSASISSSSDDDGLPGENALPSGFTQFPKAEFKQSVAKRIFPLSLVFVAMVTFNNVTLWNVQVSFYTVARSLTIVFNVALSRLMLGVPTSPKAIVCLGVVIFGFFIGIKGEVDFNLTGTFFGVFSSIFVSLNSIYTKKTLPAVDDDSRKLAFYNNANACIIFLPVILLFESTTIFKAVSEHSLSLVFWIAMLAAGLFGFFVGILTVMQIKAASPLTHNIIGTAKAAVQSLIAYAIWKNRPTFLGILGVFTVLAGGLAYTFVKMSDSRSGLSGTTDDLEMQPVSQTGKK